MAANVAEGEISMERKLQLAMITKRSEVWGPEGNRDLQEVELVSSTAIGQYADTLRTLTK